MHCAAELEKGLACRERVSVEQQLLRAAAARCPADQRVLPTHTDYTADEFRSFVSTNLEGLISHLELLFAWTHLDSPYGGDK